MKNEYPKNPFIQNEILSVEIVLHPSWWNHNAGQTFDEDFFYHPMNHSLPINRLVLKSCKS